MARVLVIGSINMDVVARVPHIPRPGETLSGTDLNYYPGGKGANQAIASAQSGADTWMVGAVGNDTFADTLLDFLQSKKVETKYIHSASTPTGTALINVDESGENCIVIIPGANATVTSEPLEALAMQDGDIVLAQLEIPLPSIADAFRQARKSNTITILNAAPMCELDEELLGNTSHLIVNEIELSMMTGTTITEESTDEEILSAIKKTSATGFSGTCLVTLGKRGCIAYDPAADQLVRRDGFAAHAIDTTGAGDCFVGVFASMLSQGKNLGEAIANATAAASVSVERAGAGVSMPTIQEIVERLNS